MNEKVDQSGSRPSFGSRVEPERERETRLLDHRGRVRSDQVCSSILDLNASVGELKANHRRRKHDTLSRRALSSLFSLPRRDPTHLQKHLPVPDRSSPSPQSPQNLRNVRHPFEQAFDVSDGDVILRSGEESDGVVTSSDLLDREERSKEPGSKEVFACWSSSVVKDAWRRRKRRGCESRRERG